MAHLIVRQNNMIQMRGSQNFSAIETNLLINWTHLKAVPVLNPEQEVQQAAGVHLRNFANPCE